MSLVTLPKPCPSCPWRVDQTAKDIPNFKPELAIELQHTCPDKNGYGPDGLSKLFACHQSKEGEEIICAGWLATVGHRSMRVRLAVMQRQLSSVHLNPGENWPELHSSYPEVLTKLLKTSS